MTILVTGGAGYIGSHMVHELVDAGEPVVVLDNLSTGFRFLVPGKVPFVAGSTGDRDLVSQTLARHGVTPIIHFAASIVVPDSVRDPLGYYSNNTMNTCALLDVAIKAGVQQFIFSSTAAVYGNAEQVPVREDAPTAPISPYGSSKLVGDHAARCRRGPWAALRGVALLQRRRRRSEAAHRAIDAERDPSDQGRLRSRARQTRQDRRIRHRLPDARRHLHPRLHPCQRSRARTLGGAGLSAPRRR